MSLMQNSLNAGYPPPPVFEALGTNMKSIPEEPIQMDLLNIGPSECCAGLTIFSLCPFSFAMDMLLCHIL